MSHKTLKSIKKRKKRALRIRKKIRGSAQKPRLSVMKTLKHIGAQVIDDEIKLISRISDDALKEKKLQDLVESVERNPERFLRRKISSKIDKLKLADLEGLSSLKIPKIKQDKFLSELKKYLQGCQK